MGDGDLDLLDRQRFADRRQKHNNFVLWDPQHPVHHQCPLKFHICGVVR